jgi:hypothetical protein
VPLSLKNVLRNVNSLDRNSLRISKYVHNIIQSLIVGEDAEQWMKEHKRFKNGRTDFLTVVAHFKGEGNNTRRIGGAELLEEALHYKDERAMPFQTFLMFNIVGEHFLLITLTMI